MSLSYQKILEDASSQMILIHDPNILIKLILKTVVKNINVHHAGMLLYDSSKDCYILTVSTGNKKYRLPEGFAKIGRANPLIVYFNNLEKYRFFKDNYLILSQVKSLLNKPSIKRKPEYISILEGIKHELGLYQATACIPCFFHKDLLGLALLGKKNRGGEFTPAELGFLSVLSSDVSMALKNAWLFKDLKSQLEKNKTLFLNMIKALSSAIEAKDLYTSGHTERVTDYALKIADEIYDLGIIDKGKYLELKDDLRIAGLLHDIGKIGIPEKILNKKAPLTPSERKIIKQHPIIGYNIISSIKEIKNASLGVKYHHERYDGQGYPEGLKGKRVPLIASIITVADSFDAMITERPYRKSLTRQNVLDEIRENKGKQFNPLVVEAFLSACRKRKI